MRQANKRIPESAEKTVRDIRRATRRHHSAEEKVLLLPVVRAFDLRCHAAALRGARFLVARTLPRHAVIAPVRSGERQATAAGGRDTLRKPRPAPGVDRALRGLAQRPGLFQERNAPDRLRAQL